MEADGLITHTASGGRKVYHITDSGRAELTMRAAELTQLEKEIHDSVADLAALAEEVDESVRGSIRDLKRELRQAKQDAKTSRVDEWRQQRDAWADTPTKPFEPTEVERKVGDLAAEVRRLVAAGRASPEDMRVAATVLDSVRDQLRHILRG
jgi:DNA-binding PadR family transcriptional regulator